ncbi:hypothetical protein GCM10023093_18030 [Nemorincola caseinilytica]|uniref:Uncharacterized protein n=1 Tax=Nemorincola caseinilytica TaxID=2054315 RepID=A0ABP8NFR6_9BACT
MKRVLFALFMLTATIGVTSVQPVSAYTPAPAAPVTQSAFNAKVNLMDTQLGDGNITAAQATWEEIHTMMLSVLATTKTSIQTASSPAVEASYRSILDNQIAIYRVVWGLKPNLAANRAAIHTKLGDFSATIY